MAATHLYRQSLALLTDLYQLTMAYGYWRAGLAERPAVFHLTFREHPFGGQYAVACGLSHVVDFLGALRFSGDDLSYLADLRGSDNNVLFDAAFLDYLGKLRFRCDVDGIIEGTVVFAHQPLLRVQGPLLQAQLLETPLLTLINFPTLVATKASRIVGAAEGRPVLEFGLRRAQGIDGGVTASRAAYIGGCEGTSNVLAGRLFDIPVKGTHAHSWVMVFDDEREAFERYADALPANCIFLVDTYDTLDGVRNAVEVGRRLREQGFRMLGIRLDSGDLGSLSRQAREILDEAGMSDAAIVASSDLDEHAVNRLLDDGARIDIWGVGTRLATAYDQPALGGIYKLAALLDDRGDWSYRVKLSEQDAKISDPGILQIRRFYQPGGRPAADVIYDEPTGIEPAPLVVPLDGSAPKRLDGSQACEDLLVPIFREGHRVYDPPDAGEARSRTLSQLDLFDPRILRLCDPEPYVVARESRLEAIRGRLVAAARAR